MCVGLLIYNLCCTCRYIMLNVHVHFKFQCRSSLLLSSRHKFEKVFELKTQQVYFVYLSFIGRNLESLLQTWCGNFLFTWADILSEKNAYFGQHLLCKTATDYTRVKLHIHVQGFTTGKNFSFNQCHKKEFCIFSRES